MDANRPTEQEALDRLKEQATSQETTVTALIQRRKTKKRPPNDRYIRISKLIR